MSERNQATAAGAALLGAINWDKVDLQAVILAGNQSKLGKPLTEWLASQGWEVAQVVQQKPISVGILQLISAGKNISLDASDGTELLADQAKLFPGYLDSDFVNYGTNVPGPLMPAVKVEVYEMVRNGDFAKIFESFNTNLDSLCLSQGQIVQFVKNHSKWLHPKGYATMFLFKVGDEFFVARVYRRDGGLWARVYRFSNAYVWPADYRLRVVVPQLKLES